MKVWKNGKIKFKIFFKELMNELVDKVVEKMVSKGKKFLKNIGEKLRESIMRELVG